MNKLGCPLLRSASSRFPLEVTARDGVTLVLLQGNGVFVKIDSVSCLNSLPMCTDLIPTLQIGQRFSSSSCLAMCYFGHPELAELSPFSRSRESFPPGVRVVKNITVSDLTLS